jgi:hypothetical protein
MAMEIYQSRGFDAELTFAKGTLAIADDLCHSTPLHMDFNAAVAGTQAAKSPFRHNFFLPNERRF